MTLAQRCIRFFAVLGCCFAAGHAQADVLTAYGVDSALGGSMDVESYVADPHVDNIMHITAQNPLSSTTTYYNVGLAMEFFYPGDGSGNITGDGFIYEGGGVWGNTGVSATDSQQLQITGSSPVSTIVQTLDPSQILVPLTNMSHGFSAGSLLQTDSVPLIQLGDFAPGDTEPFQVSYSELKGGPFFFVTDAFFVAVPEPSTIGLTAMGGAILLIRARRKLRGLRRAS